MTAWKLPNHNQMKHARSLTRQSAHTKKVVTSSLYAAHLASCTAHGIMIVLRLIAWCSAEEPHSPPISIVCAKSISAWMTVVCGVCHESDIHVRSPTHRTRTHTHSQHNERAAQQALNAVSSKQ